MIGVARIAPNLLSSYNVFWTCCGELESLTYLKRVPMTDRIAINPQIHFGKPCVAGTRITVQSVLELVREGISFAEIVRNYYPDLSVDDVRACVQYALDVVTVEEIHPSAIK